MISESTRFRAFMCQLRSIYRMTRYKCAHALSRFDSDELDVFWVLPRVLNFYALEENDRFVLHIGKKIVKNPCTMSSSKCVKQPRKTYTKEQHEMTYSEKLRLIDDELNSFYK